MKIPTRKAMLEALEFAAEASPDENQAATLRAAAELIRQAPAPNPPAPLPRLEVAADPEFKGLHPLHECRYIVTEGTQLEPMDHSYAVDGSIVATMTDHERQAELAYCMAAGPELLEAAKAAVEEIEEWIRARLVRGSDSQAQLLVAIAKASGPSPHPSP